MSDIIRGLDSIALHVRDIKKARQFYGHVLGLKELRYDEKGESGVFAVAPGVNLHVHVQAPQEPGRPAGTVSGIILATDDIQKAVAEVKRRGGAVTDEPSPRPWGVTYATVADPDGNEILLAMPTR